MTRKQTAQKVLLILALAAAPQTGHADSTHTNPASPEGHAPIMVMGDHMHNAGEFMVSARHMTMRMRGNMKGTNELSDAQVLAEPNQHGVPMTLRVVPQKMDMEMTMLGAMYAPSDAVTLLAMVMQIDNEMVLQSYQGMMGETPCASPFLSKSNGRGDTIIGALFRGGETANGQWHSGLALSLPTGAVDKTSRPIVPMGCVPAAMNKRLPYPMQLGSGSYELKPSLTYNGDWRGWRVGGQANATLRLDDNDENYRLGDKFELQGWAMKNLAPNASASLRLAPVIKANWTAKIYPSHCPCRRRKAAPAAALMPICPLALISSAKAVSCATIVWRWNWFGQFIKTFMVCKCSAKRR